MSQYPIEQQETRVINRITWKKVFDDILIFFDLNTGVMLIIKDLLIRPRHVIEGYFGEKRFEYINPGRALFVSTALVVFLYTLVYDEKNMPIIVNDDLEGIESRFKPFLENIGLYVNAVLITMLPFYALVSYRLFKRKNYNFVEHLYISAFLFFMTNVFSLLMFPLFAVPALDTLQFFIINYMLYFAYQIYFYTNIFDGAVPIRILKSILVNIFAFTLYAILLFISSITILAFFR